MEIHLHVSQGNVKKGSLTFDKREIIVGRGLTCDVIVNDPSVSNRHFTILKKGNNYFLKDEGSVNGTFVNGVQVVDEVKLYNGDRITFCGYVVEVSLEGNERVEKGSAKNTGNKTVVLQRQDLMSDLKKAGEGKKKKTLLLLGVILILIIGGIFAVFMMPSKKRTVKRPIQVGVIDSYFLKLERRMDKDITDKKNPENAKRFFDLGREKLKMKNLNRENLYNAFLYFLKAKKSIQAMSPKPPIWDEIIPALNKTKRELKMTLKKLFKDAWLLENDGNREGAKDVYLAIMQTIPDENSQIYIIALRRYNLLK